MGVGYLTLATITVASRAKHRSRVHGQEATIPGTNEALVGCTADQVVQAGCRGRYGTTSFLASLGTLPAQLGHRNRPLL
jgi:hypothetical protein